MSPVAARALAALVGLAGGAGCVVQDYIPDVGSELSGTCKGEDSDPSRTVSFARDLRPLFDRPRTMGGCSCHTPTNGTPSGIELGGLDLGSVASLRQGGHISGAEIIVPGDPCRSLLLQKLGTTPPFGSRMPLDGPAYLTEDELALVHDWIAEGAEDN